MNPTKLGMSEKKPNMLISALIGGAFLGIISALPILEYLNCACCGVLVSGGVLTSYLYIRESSSRLEPVSYADGALLGLLSGILGSVVYILVRVPLFYVQITLGLTISEVQADLNDPNIPEPLRAILQELLQSGMLIFIEIFFFLVTALIFSTLGGILGITIFQKKPPRLVPSSSSLESQVDDAKHL